MSSLPDVRRLLRIGEYRKQRCEQNLLQAQRRLQPIVDELAEIAAQSASLQQLMATQRAADCCLSYPELMALLRRQALVRRKQQNLALERVRLDEQRAHIELDVQAYQHERQTLLRKHMKFSGLQQRLLRQQGLALLRREETEIEELSRPST